MASKRPQPRPAGRGSSTSGAGSRPDPAPRPDPAAEDPLDTTNLRGKFNIGVHGVGPAGTLNPNAAKKPPAGMVLPKP